MEVKKIKSFPLKFEKNTLSQLSIIINDKKIDKHGVYFQTYENNTKMISEITSKNPDSPRSRTIRV